MRWARAISTLLNVVSHTFVLNYLVPIVHDRRARKFDVRYRNHPDLFCQMIAIYEYSFVEIDCTAAEI